MCICSVNDLMQRFGKNTKVEACATTTASAWSK